MDSKHKHKQKLLRPKLDRRNAIKNIDYEASTSDDSTNLRTHSLDLSPTSSRTSFRIQGSAAEFDQICRRLGLSGPEDFAIPAAAWEARKALSSPALLPRSRSDPPEKQSVAEEVTREPRSRVRVRFAHEIEVGNENGRDNKNYLNGFDLSSVRSGGGGIKGVRPPPVLTPPPVMRRPAVDNVSSTWDLLKSFAPPGDEPLDSLRSISEVASSSDEEDVVVERNNVNGGNAVMVEPRLSPSSDKQMDSPSQSLIVNPSDGEENREIKRDKVDGENIGTEESCSSSTNDGDENSNMTLEPIYGISPNGQFSRRINSWQKGELLGSGSFGTVYEGYTE